MRITRLWIDGYGRFSGKELSFEPGLQILAGPNERGKSTVRGFICDMLYGQKRSATQRLYDPTHELRIPWSKTATYGGRLEYELASGTLYEVQRVFDRDTESVKVFDRTNVEDITAEFPKLRNREPTFADVHLQMTRPVFLGVATINHASLEGLGDEAAMARIRDKLSSLTDSGEVDRSSETALKWLSDRLGSIGQKTARKRPLPLARTRLDELQKEYGEIRAVRSEIAQVESQRVEVLQRIGAFTRDRDGLEARIAEHERRSQAERLKKAEALSEQIDGITKACFGLGDLREFPLGDADRVRELAPALDAAERQAGMMAQEREELKARVDQEIERLGSMDVAIMPDPSLEQEERLTELDERIRKTKERVAELEETIASLETRQREARAKLEGLPDFIRLSSDPVEWLTQIASSFHVARKTRDSDREQLDKLREAVAIKRAATEEPGDIFSRCEDFPALAREYHATASQKSSTLLGLERETEILHATADDIESRLSGLMLFTILSLSGAVFTAFIAFYVKNPGIYIATVCASLMTVYFGGLLLVSQRRVRKALERLDEIEYEERDVSVREAGGRQHIEELLQRSGCGSVRELEALYDHYRANVLERDLLADQLEIQEERTKESEGRVSALYDRLTSTFLSVGEKAEDQDDVQGAAMRAISRYQQYRDAKRRVNECRDLLKVRGEELGELGARLDTFKAEELELALTMRQFFRDNHYPEEARNDSALAALRGYRMRAAQVRQRRGQLELYEDKLRLLDEKLPEEQARMASIQDELNRLLAKAQAEDIGAFRDAADKAAQYRDLRTQLAALEEQLTAVLDGQDIEALRAAAGEFDRFSGDDDETVPELNEHLRRTNDEIEACRKHEHELHLSITGRTGGMRTLNEVEEERDAIARRLQELELELQAATYAMSVLEEVTRARHSIVAPRLAERASAYLAEITGGAYDEVMVNRDLKVTVRLPETKVLHDRPEQALSKGTVDQIYLALRLAMVDSLTEGAESVPMLLDDPFANYDDARLARAMKLLQRVAETHQILLFTCRDDVVEAAEAAGAPILFL